MEATYPRYVMPHTPMQSYQQLMKEHVRTYHLEDASIEFMSLSKQFQLDVRMV